MAIDYYADFGAANDGDGTTHSHAGTPGGAGAWNTLVGKVLAVGDTVWARRAFTGLLITAPLTLTAQSFIIGWPKVGDKNYDTRPSGPRATWDSDPGDYPEITCSTSGQGVMAFAAGSGASELHRIRLVQNATNTVNTVVINVAATASPIFYNCVVECIHALTDNTKSITVVAIAANSAATMHNTTIRHIGAVTSSHADTCMISLYGGLIMHGSTITVTSSGFTRRLVHLRGGCSMYMNKCTINHSGTGIATPPFYFNGTSIALTINDCDFSHDTTTSSLSWFLYSASHSGHSMSGYRVRMNKGVKWTMPPQFHVHFERFNQTSNSSTFGIETRGLTIDCGGTITGTNFSFATNTIGDIQLRPGVLCMIDNCALESFTPFGVPGAFPGYWCKDADGTVGSWAYTGPNATSSKNTAHRDDGEDYSIKCQTTAVEANNVGILPGLETLWVSVPASAVTVTVYIAAKGVVPDAGNLWIETEYLDEVSGGHKEFASTRDMTYAPAALGSDASAWSGDSGLTMYKIELPIVPGQACVIPVRLFMSASTGGTDYILIDPKVEAVL